MKAKIFLSVILVFILVTVVCACANSETPSTTDTSTNQTSEPVSDDGTQPMDIASLDAGADTEGIDISKINTADYKTISVADYLDKTAAGHISQYIGFLSGYEFARDSSGNILIGMPDEWFEICNGPYADPNEHNTHEDKLLYNEKKQLWEIYNDDDFSIDILNQYIISDMYESYGTISSRSIKDGWIKYDVYDMGGGHRQYGAYGLFKSFDYLPDFIGRAEFGNRYGVNGEPYIANETIGLNCPGMPETALELTDMFASVTSDMDPVLWARFFSAMYSLAYFEDDIPTLIDEARAAVPEKCVVTEVIDEVLAIRKQYPTSENWRFAAKLIDKTVYRHHYGQDKKMGETSINCAFVLLGLLWGEGDYYETCKMISLAGHGGDSTTPVGLGIVGVISGMDKIPEEALAKTWQDGAGVVVNVGTGKSEGYWMCALGLPKYLYMKDTIQLYQKNFESILREQGGFRYDGVYYIPKQENEVIETPLYEDFDDGKLGGATVSGTVTSAAEKDSYMGKHAMKLTGTSDAYIKVSGLVVGEKYTYSAYVHADTDTLAYLYAKAEGESGKGKFATVYSTKKYVLREFVFTATAESMNIGVKTEGGSYVIIDDVLLTHTSEVQATDKVSLSASNDGKYTEKFTVTVSEKFSREIYLKVSFSNLSSILLNGKITVNGESYGAVPFYRTGKELQAGNCDTVYIPLVLTADTNEIVISVGKGREIYIKDVSVIERF